MNPIKSRIEKIYSGTFEEYKAFLTYLDTSLNPRSPDVLFDKFAALNPSADTRVLDAGCRHAVQACELHKRFGCRVEGIDFVDDNIREANKHILENSLEQSIYVQQGDIEALPYTDACFDLIWCRDVLSHMTDLTQAFRECVRVLKPGGKMLIFAMFETALMTDEEAARFWPPIAVKRENVTVSTFEDAFKSAGFSSLEADELHSEWREYLEEHSKPTTSKQLVRIARMMRNRDHYVEKFGEEIYESELCNCLWGVYQMLGKLSPRIYTIVKMPK